MGVECATWCEPHPHGTSPGLRWSERVYFPRNCWGTHFVIFRAGSTERSLKIKPAFSGRFHYRFWRRCRWKILEIRGQSPQRILAKGQPSPFPRGRGCLWAMSCQIWTACANGQGLAGVCGRGAWGGSVPSLSAALGPPMAAHCPHLAIPR